MGKYIPKITRTQAVVKITGTGSTTIDTAELAYHDQTVDRDNVSLTITGIVYNVGSAANVVRNSNVVFSMASSTYDEYQFSQSGGYSLNEEANANVIVNLGANESSVVLQFSKEAGYIDPNRQILQPYER